MSSGEDLTDASKVDAHSQPQHGNGNGNTQQNEVKGNKTIADFDDLIHSSPTTPFKIKLDNFPLHHHRPHKNSPASTTTTTPKLLHSTPIRPSSNTNTSTNTNANYHLDSEVKMAYFVGDELANDQKLISALKELGIEPSNERITESNVNTLDLDCASSIIIFPHFSGSLFESIRKKPPSQRPRIFGPCVIIWAAQSKEKKLPVSRLGYPIYSPHLHNCRLAATGFKSKEQLQEVRRLILFMGGSFQEKISESSSSSSSSNKNENNNENGGVVTHLIADKCRGVKYQDAVYLGKPILTPQWIYYLWKYQNNVHFDITSSMPQFRVKCFHGCKIALLGFETQEKEEMTKLVVENGGNVVEAEDPQATHIVQSAEYYAKTTTTTTEIITAITTVAKTTDGQKTPSQNQSTPVKTSSSTNFRKSLSHRTDFPEDEYENGASPLKRARFESHVTNDLNESEVEAAKNREFPNPRAKILRVEWFWNSVQIESCADEKIYIIQDQKAKTTAMKDFDQTITSPNSYSFFSPMPNYSIVNDDVMNKSEDGESATPKSTSVNGTPTGTNSFNISIGRRKRKYERIREHPQFISETNESEILEKVERESELKREENPSSSSSTSSSSASAVLNLGGNSLSKLELDDKTFVSDAVLSHVFNQLAVFFNTTDLKDKTRRFIEFYQLLETERNYVTVLMNIVKIFKEPCENENQPGGRILSPREINTIFSTILPIYALHRRLLRDLVQLQNPWKEENLIGKIYFDYAKELRKAYEPFVNFFESVKAEIVRCEKEKPRFLALLRIAKCKPECGKQSLSELFIRPVQRLPSTALLLSNLEKHTPKEINPDSEWLSKGLSALSFCMKSLNEQKAINEARVAIFETFNEIDGCPASTISDHRKILVKFDVTSLVDFWGCKYEPITLFIFTDHIQITKRRGVGNSLAGAGAGNISVANLKSPMVPRKPSAAAGSSCGSGSGSGTMMNHNYNQNQATGSNYNQQKKYKFYEWIEFTEIRRVLDIYDTASPTFAFVVRGPRDLRERILIFTCPEDSEWPKEKVLVFMAKQLANSANRVDFENLIAKSDSASLNVNENSSSVLEKAAKFATKTRNKVGRALSFNRTPSKLMKRTVSQMLSPFTMSRRRLNPRDDKDKEKEKDPDVISISSSQFDDDSPPPSKINNNYKKNNLLRNTPKVPSFFEKE